MCYTVEALAGFHVLQSSVSVDGVPAVSQMQDAHVCAQPTAQNPLFQTENKDSLSPALNTSEGFFLRNIFFFFPSPTFLVHVWDKQKLSHLGWCQDIPANRISSKIFSHLYVQPVISPSKQGRTQPWCSESSNVLMLVVMCCWITLAICYLDSHRSASLYWADI